MELKYILLFVMPFIGGLMALFSGHPDTKRLKLFLAFSGAFLFSITILEILPSLYTGPAGEGTGIYVLAGFFFQVLIEQFTRGIEHGHIHAEKDRKVPVMVILGLCIHSFIEGLPMGGGSFLSYEQRNSLIYGVALHEAPAAFSLIVLLRYSRPGSALLIMILLLYSCMSLLGIAWSNIMVNQLALPATMINKILALVIGTFLHISTTILFENSDNHGFGRIKLIAILAGVGLALLIINLHIILE
jgi:zinc and cadmium transporter